MRKTEEQLKTDIFSIYSRYLNEPSSDRRQVDFAQIYGVIISWCTDYLKIKANEMGMEIFDAVQRLIEGSNTKVPKDETGFFKYLKTVLFTAQKEYYRNNEESPIHISRGTRKKLKMVEEFLTKKESNMGGKLTENERRYYISKYFSIEKYTKLMNLKNTGRLEINGSHNDDTDGKNLLNLGVKLPYGGSASTDPQDEYLAKLDMQDLKDALDYVLRRTQDRTHDCYRSLFTAYCIKNLVDFEVLTPLLDQKILEVHRKSGKKPKQYEIYMEYHPEIKKAGAEARAAQMTKEFLEKLNAALLEKNH